MKLSKNEVLVLRTCNAGMISYGRFVWPELGHVEAPDWEPTEKSGNGLHGFLWGEGNGNLISWKEDAKWLVVKVNKEDLIKLDGKVKFKRGDVIYSGNRKKATKLIIKHKPEAVVIGVTKKGNNVHVGYGGKAIAGNYGEATAGNYGEVTAGNYGKAIVGYKGAAYAGNSGMVIAGDYGEAIAGRYGTATAGNYGEVTAGYKGTAIVGDYGKAVSGVYGKAIAGSYGKAIVGYEGKAIAGDRGEAIAGSWGKVQAGNNGVIETEYYEIDNNNRLRKVVGYIGEDGLKANVLYHLNNEHKFEEVR